MEASFDSANALANPERRHRSKVGKAGRMMRLVVTFTLAGALAASCWAAGRSTAHAATPGRAPTPPDSARSCARTCRAAYRAIAEALPEDRAGNLARAILRTPSFDYLELDHALHIPTTAQVRTQWHRFCRSRYPSDSRTQAICVQMIDSWKPMPLPASPVWATS